MRNRAPSPAGNAPVSSRESGDPAGRRRFPVSRSASDRFGLNRPWPPAAGGRAARDLRPVQELAARMNRHHPAGSPPVRASEINALGLIFEIFQLVMDEFRRHADPAAGPEALAWLESRVGRPALDGVMIRFLEEFPSLLPETPAVTPAVFLEGMSGPVSNREIVLDEILLTVLTNENPATGPLRTLIQDQPLARTPAYRSVSRELHQFYSTRPRFGPAGQHLPDMLRSPARAVPQSLGGQLKWIRLHWAFLLPSYLLELLLTGLDLIKEEEKAAFEGPGPSAVMEFAPGDGQTGVAEPEQFSPDRDWMPRLVLMAKSTQVWLDQLSRRYGREIRTLDQIPGEELDRLAAWGFTGLWLIGVWERSPASRKIKQMCGNPEAMASAYSLAGYEIAAGLGGEPALLDLKHRAWERGIRLAADMVPNHMGIDSPWVMEHPGWFVQMDHPPFPVYSFNGPNLSGRDDFGIYLEDHYYDRTDAAVVFKWVNFHTGETRYMYHGNDGTRMPWNDTAQLNYLHPDVREAVIRTILKVSRLFPVIRFDAAMTLAKRHYQRLWFPEPGTGGDIPSRAGQGLSKAGFDQAMPVEFWREVVDRTAAEAPDTLLLAEAFWLMEGYFVRTLGMHRVYNSAFMNFLKNEDNGKFRQSIRNVLEFNPEILKRFVNFVNNPDEETAVHQFGKGGKYMGVCLLMATLPGLPMFGHGQVEGLAEKYGMEYQRAYWDESPDQELIQRHERLIFPLLRRRYLFAEVRNFLLFDLFSGQGGVNENVIAFTNRFHDEQAMVIFHNRYAEAAGWLRTSAAYPNPGEGDGLPLKQYTLAEGLQLPDDPDRFVLFRDHAAGLDYIRNCREFHREGLRVNLGAYQFQVFLDFRVVADSARQPYRQLCQELNGQGVPDLSLALQELLLRPLADLFRTLADPRRVQVLLEDHRPDILHQFSSEWEKAFIQLAGHCPPALPPAESTRRFATELQTLLGWARWAREFPPPVPEPVSVPRREAGPEEETGRMAAVFRNIMQGDGFCWVPLWIWLAVRSWGRCTATPALETLHRWHLLNPLEELPARRDDTPEATRDRITLVKILSAHDGWLAQAALHPDSLPAFLETLLQDGEISAYLRINYWQDILWFHQESFETWLDLSLLQTALNFSLSPGQPPDLPMLEKLAAAGRMHRRLQEAARTAGCRWENFLDELAGPGFPESGPGTAPASGQATGPPE